MSQVKESRSRWLSAFTLQGALLVVATTCIAAGLWALTQPRHGWTVVALLGGFWCLGTMVERWRALNELESAQHLARARHLTDTSATFHHAREAWRLAEPGSQAQADALVVLASRYVNEAKGDEARSLLRSMPPGFSVPVSIAADALLLHGSSSEALALLDSMPAPVGPLGAHHAHLRVRALLQLKQFPAAAEFLLEPSREACFEAFEETQQALLDEGRLEASIAVGEQGQSHGERALGAWLLAEAYRRAGRPDDERRWRETSERLGFQDAMQLDLRELMDAVRIGPPLAVRRPRPTALPADPSLAGHDVEPLSFFGRWLLVTTLAVTAAQLVSSLSVLGWDPRITRSPSSVHAASTVLLGLIAATPQFFVLRRSLPGAGWWVAASVLGVLMGDLAGYGIATTSVLALRELGLSEDSLLPFIITDSRLFIAFALQAVVLRRWFPRVGLWVPVIAASLGSANLLATLIWQKAQALSLLPASVSVFFVRAMTFGLLEGLFVGAASAWILTGWMMKRRSGLSPSEAQNPMPSISLPP